MSNYPPLPITTLTPLKPGMLRVTTVLDYFEEPELVAWKIRIGKKEANRQCKRALKIGSRIDSLIKTNAQPVVKDSDQVKQCYKAWLAFLKDFGVKQEEFIVCKRFYIESEGITGEPDLFHPLLGLIDIKCSSNIRSKYWLQLAKYHQGMKLLDTNSINVLRLDKNLGIYEFVNDMKIGISISYAIEVFDSLHTAYKFFNPNGDNQENANGTSNDSKTEVSSTDSKERDR